MNHGYFPLRNSLWLKVTSHLHTPRMDASYIHDGRIDLLHRESTLDIGSLIESPTLSWGDFR
jgi:hypothetical protein